MAGQDETSYSRPIESPLGKTIRIPPQNIEAEISTLGSLLIDGSSIYKVMDVVRSEDFYRPQHQVIYSTIMELFDKREPIDVLSVSSRLREKNNLEQAGGVSYLTELVNSVPTASNVGYYAELVRKKRVLRSLIQVAGELSDLGYKESEDTDALLDEAEKRIFSLAQRSLHQKFTSLDVSLRDAFERYDNLHKNKHELSGVPTGFKQLDDILAGFQKSDLIILAARPSFGKTSLALDIARHAAVHKNIPVGIFSLEMSTQQIVDRFIAAEAHVDLWKLRTGRIPDEGDDFARIRDALDNLSKAPIFIDDAASSNILQMRAMARRLQADRPDLGLLIIDYLQLMTPRTSTDSMVQQVTEISRSLKTLAKELNVPVLAVSQLSRAVENRHPPIPRLSDLRESGSIEQDADVVMFIYREDRYKENSQKPNQVEVLVAKHRNGPLGNVNLYFNDKKSSFVSLDQNSDFESFDID